MRTRWTGTARLSGIGPDRKRVARASEAQRMERPLPERRLPLRFEAEACGPNDRSVAGRAAKGRTRALQEIESVGPAVRRCSNDGVASWRDESVPFAEQVFPTSAHDPALTGDVCRASRITAQKPSGVSPCKITSPPCARAMVRAILRPSPVPSRSRPRAGWLR